MLWIPLASWTFIALASLQRDHSLTGATGHERLLATDPARACAIRSSYRSTWPQVLLVAGAAAFGAVAIVSAAAQDWASCGGALVGTALAGLAARSRQRAAPRVLASLVERDLEMLHRETSRLRRYGAASALAFVAGLPLVVTGVLGDHPPLTLAGAALLSLGTVALAWLAWASAWRYGDERPAPEPGPQT